LGRITSDLADFESALKASNARVLAFGASTAVLGGSVKVFKEIANITIEIEKSLTDVNRVLGLSTSGLQKFSTELFSISKQTASSFDDATKAALEFSRQGLNTQETLKRTADALTLVRLTGISSRQAVEDLTSTINGFSKAGLTTSQVVNKLAAVEQDFAVSASDLTEALSRTGQAAQEAGVGFDELNALVTTAQQSTARGGAVIGNALKTIFTRLQRTDTLEQLENFNISVRDIEGNILPATQILKNFADQYKNLADSQRAQLSEQVAGVYQVNILKGIIGDLSNAQGTYTKALERGTMASNEADIANQKLNKTLSALSTQTGLGLQQLANNIGKVTFAPIFEAIVSPINDAVTYINETLEGEGPGSIFANGLLKGIRNVITGPGLAVAFAVIAKVAKNTFEDATKALPAILGITTEAQRRANIEKSILAILQTQSNLSLALQGQQGNATAQAATVLNYAKLQTAQYQQQLQIAQQLAPLLAAQNVTIGARGVQVGAKIKAGGHIPAFAEMSERMGAAMGGYKSGKVVKAPKSVGANTYMNTAEETKYVPGFTQPFINPPAGSKAGRAHRQNAISRTGVDPYTAGGFIPNFSESKYFDQNFNRKKQILRLKGTDSNPLIIPNNKELSPITNPGLDSVFGLKYEIILAGSKATFEKDFDKKMQAAQQAKNLLEYSSLNDAQKNTFIEDYQRYKNNKNKDFLVKPFTPNKKEEINFSKQLQGVKSDTLGNLYEKYLEDEFQLKRYKNQNAISDLDFVNAEAKFGDYDYANLLAKAIRQKAKTTKKFKEKPHYKNKDADIIDLENKTLKLYTTNASQGFIPNFGIPMEAGRIPWFKKYSTLLKNTSGDKDLFRQKDFPTFGNGLDHFYATNGNNDMVGSLYEKFILSAMNIARNSSVFKTTKELGLKEFPVTDLSNTAAFDLGEDMGPEGLIGIQAKAGSKNNQTSGGGVNKTLTSNIKRFGDQNPSRIKDLKKAVLIYNDPRYHDPTGKNPAGFLSPFEQTISGIVKSNYSSVDEALKPKLTKVTDDLLSYYEKNKNTKNAKSLFDGFVPNFGNNIDATSSSMRKALGLMPFLVDLKRKTYAEADMFHYQIANSKFIDPETGKSVYGSLSDKDMHGSTYQDTFVRGFYNASLGKAEFELTKAQKEDKNFMPKHSALLEKVKARYAERFKSAVPVKAKRVSPLAAFRNEGFIPNFARNSPSFVNVKALSKNPVTYSGDLLDFMRQIEASAGRNLSKGEERALKYPGANLSKLNDQNALDKFLDSEGASGFARLAKGFIPNFASRREMIRDLVKFNLESTPDIKDKNVFGSKTTLFRGVRNKGARYSGKFGRDIFEQSRNYSTTENDIDYFRDTDINKIANDHIKEKKLLPFLSASRDEDIAKYFARGREDSGFSDEGKVGSKTINNSRIFSAESIRKFTKKYGQKALKQLMMEHSTWGTFGLGKGVAMNFESFSDKRGFEGTDFAKEISFLSNGFIPNFNSIKGRNSFQKNWLIETAKKRNLNLNDPNVFSKLGAEFAKTYPNDQGMFGLSEGFIPNFAYKQAVMGLEESMSGNKAVLDTKSGPFPFIRNTSQSNFASAISDHGGLSNALSDSIRNQEAAGLMNKGYVPNFAVVKSRQSLGADFASLSDTEKTLFLQLNIALTRLTKDTTLTSQQQQLLQTTVQNNALMLQQSTKSINIVNDANHALVLAIQQNQDAQKAAAKAAKAQAGPSTPKKADQTLSTRIGGLFGGKRGAVRGRQFDRSLGGLSNNIGFTLAAPMVGGILESAIGGGKDRSEMGYGRRLASSGVSAGLTGLSTGAAIGSAVPGIGTAAGAAIGAIVGFSGAMISAQTTLEDLSRSMSKVVSNNKSDIDSAKKLLALQTQLASESDPYKIMELKDAIEETSGGIKNSDFANKILRSAGSVDDFNKAVSDFSKSTKPIEVLERLPDLIAQMSKELKISEQGGNMGAITGSFNTFGNFATKSFKNIIEGDKLPFLSAYTQIEKEANKNGKKAQRLVDRAFTGVSGIFLDLEDSIIKDKPELLNDYNDLIKNFSIYKDQGNLDVKLKPFIDAGLVTQDLADNLVKVAEEATNDVFQGYLKNLSNGLKREKGKRIETKANSNKLIQDTESLKNVFSKINTDISKSLFETAINLENIEFKSSLDKLNFEKLGEIFDTSFSSIGKNLEESAKSQFELLSSRFKYARENSALLERDISFGETTQAKQKQFSLQRSERVSTFLEANLKNNPANRGAADAFIQQSKLIYDNNIENIKNLGLKQDETSKRALDKFVQEEKEKKATFDNAQKNSATLFNAEQTYAQKILKFKQKIAEADFKLDQRKLDNALKEKQVIESFNFANQMIQAKTQADVNMMGIAAEVNPNFNVGKSKFQQEDIRFKQEREKTSMQLAAGIRTSTNESRLADFQQRILADNTQATIENTNVIRDANLIALNERKSSIEQNVLNLQNTLSAYTRSIPQAQEDESYQNYVEDRSPLGASFLSTNNQNPFSANSAANFLTNPVDYVAPPKADKKSNPILGGAVSLISTQKDILMSFLKSIINGSEYPSKMTDEEYADVRRRGAEVQARQKMENDRNYVMRPDRLNFLETRYSEQSQRANEETQNIIKNTQSISSDDKPSSIYDALNLKEFKLPGPIDIIDDERTKALNQQLVLQEKNLGFITDQIDATYGLVDAQNKANKSLVERAVPDISKIESVESELNSLKKSQEILIKARDISIQQLNTSQNLPSQTIADRNEQALLRQKILGYDVEINKVALTTATAEYRIAEEKKRQVDYAKYLASRGKFTTGVQKAMDTIKDETEMFKETLGTTTVNSFRDGLVGAMDAALNKADDLESALMGVAAGFLREIQGVMLRNIANQAISSFMPSFGASETGNQRGGFIRAQSGMYISGGRTGDKNPALLEDGEYVLNRNAVKAMGGPKALDNLNFNSAPRFATGGDPGTMSASVSMNEPFERLSMYGREQSPEFQSYIEKLREEEAAKEKKRAERKALLNQFIGTLISTGVSMGISSAVGAAKNASQAKANLKGAVNTDTGVAISGFAESKKIIDAGGSVTLANGTLVNSSYLGGEAFTRSSFNQLASSRFSAEGIFPNRSGFSVQGAVPYGTGKNGKASINKTFKSPFDAVKYSRSLPSEFKPNIPKQRRQEGGAIGFNQGGFLPYGSRLTDSIPAYLTGGEYVVNSKAVRKYGVGGLNRINSGVARFQDGGMVDAETGSPSNTSNTSNSNVSINITVNASGGKVGDQESDSNSEGTEGNAKELSNRIKAVVLDVITTEQRTGGLLDSTKKR
jgi:TP901 family phage tail tape measure protein